MKKSLALLLVFAMLQTASFAVLIPRTDELYTGDTVQSAMEQMGAALGITIHNDIGNITLQDLEYVEMATNVYSKEVMVELFAKLKELTGHTVQLHFSPRIDVEVAGMTAFPEGVNGITEPITLTLYPEVCKDQYFETVVHEMFHLFHAYYNYIGKETELRDFCIAANDGIPYMNDYFVANANLGEEQATTQYAQIYLDKNGNNYFTWLYGATNEYEDLATLIDHTAMEPVKSQTQFLQPDTQPLYEKYRYAMDLMAANFQAGSQSPLYLMMTQPEQPAVWAQPKVEAGLAAGIILPEMNHSYNYNMTREDFCQAVMVALDGLTEENLVDSYVKKLSGTPFYDCNNPYVLAAYAAGIVKGVGNGGFQPDGSITRQEAATMLTAAMNLFPHTVNTDAVPAYSDGSSIADWARSGVRHAAAAGVLTGTDVGFEPLKTYTRQQGFVSIVRMYEYLLAA